MPGKTSEEDTSQFDQRFTNQPPVDSPDDSHLSESANLVFEGFTYVAPSILEEMNRPMAFRPRSPRKPQRGPLAFPSPAPMGAAPAEELMDTSQQPPQPKWVWQPH
ncbi:Ribosomal protein S6 kinase beta-1 [Amphibalanus amphitrite]|uniref:Ribosomal protein S6 kinase beta-1 n=1 Tax=Amphibalanus amphitrite TaxID=1232801 RepID=A0A6A4W5Y9_AMPAM|nr:Ribosomal protein S6 kinase beta-1 [Amphibalanus amphitrite]